MAGRQVVTIVEPGTLVWVNAPKNHQDIFQIAKVLAIDESTATCRTEGDSRLETIDLSAAAPFLCNPTVEPDMTGLHHIHEPAILYNMEQRSFKSEPYSFMGSVLVAVNPLKPIPNPTNCGTRQVLMGPPHPYAVAESSFQQMTFQGSRELLALEKGQPGSLKKASQSIVIGGESGAGKTESSKMVLQHLVSRQSKSSGASMNGLDARLLGTNPILEAFGNATTLRNPNSSRFGKMLRLHFDPPPTSQGTDEQWSLRGATVQSYLLERSRVTTHEQGERGYHIMYYVIAGSKNKMHPSFAGLGLEGGAGAFRYTTPLHPKLDESHDVKFVQELVDAMKAVGLSDEDGKGLFQLVAALVHMGNIEFSEKDTNEGPAAFVTNSPVSKMCAGLLGVEEDPLNKIFTERRFEVAGKEIMTVRNARAAGFARDAVAKAVYSGLFDWIMRRIDVALGGAGSNPDMTSTIGVLDIFGFETFAINGFEQLLINYTNEALQGTFNAQIFIAEAALYQREGLFGTENYMGQPLDNGICIELLQGNANIKGMETGLLMTIDNEGKVPDPSDAKMNQRLHANFGKHPCMIAPHPKDKANVFIIRHYAATVTYTVGTFLEKNNDRLPDDMERTLKASTKSILREVFELQEKAPAAAPAAPPPAAAAPAKGAPPPGAKPKAPPPARKPPARSIVHKFQGQIKQLVDDLESTKCSFIRCVKPNAAMIRNDADPSWFDRRYVKKQLDALNISQTAEVLRNGYPTRIEYSVLVESYVNVLPEQALKSWKKSEVAGGGRDNKSFVRALFYAFGVETDIYKLGLTRVFFKGGKLAELNAILKITTSGSISDDVVKRFTYFYARVKWRRAAVLSRCQNRFIMACEKAKKKTATATKLQSFVRMQPHRKQFNALKRGALTVQKLWRGRMGRRIYKARVAEAIVEAKRKAEEARARQDADALAKAEKMEREQREAQERREREAKDSAQQAAARVAAALEQQQEAREEEEVVVMSNRRKSMMPRRTTVAPMKGKVAIRPGGKLRPKPMAPKLPPPPVFDDSLLPPPPPEDDLPPPPVEPSAKDKKKNIKDKRGSFFDKLAKQQEEDFKMPTSGYTFVRFEKSRKSIALVSKLFSSKPQFKWERYFYVLNKPDRMLTLYTDATKKTVHKTVAIPTTTKIIKYTADKQKPHAAQICDGLDDTKHHFLAFETENLWKRFIKDLDDCIVGFRATVPEADEEKKKKQVDLKVVAQLNLLLFRKQITQKEFDELLTRATADAEAAESAAQEEQRENEAKLQEMKLEALTRVIATSIPYSDGRVSCGNASLVRKIDHQTFEEVFMLAIQMRFFLNKFPEKVIGWTVNHKFTEFESMSMQLLDPNGELSPEARLKLPEFPKLNYGSFAKRINREHNEGLAKVVEDWTKKLWAVLPSREADVYVEDFVPPPPAPVDPSLDPANWRSVRDPDSGELYWSNKVTGEIKYEDPLEGLAGKGVDNGLEPNWEEILDPETNETYYYNSVTEETSWERPVKVVKQEKKKLGVADLLHVAEFNNFFDIKGNVEALLNTLGSAGAE